MVGGGGAKRLLGFGGRKSINVQRIADVKPEVCEKLGGHTVIDEKGFKACIRIVDDNGTPMEAVVENLGPGMVRVTSKKEGYAEGAVEVPE